MQNWGQGVTSLDYLVATELVVVGVTFVLSFVFHARILSALKSRHLEVWQSLGEPGLLTGNSAGSTLKFRQYTRKKLHLDLGDTRLSQDVTRRRWCERLYWLGLLACVMTVVFA